MKLTFSPADRIGHTARPSGGGDAAIRVFTYGVVIPFTAVAVAASSWYIATGQTPAILLAKLTRPPHIEMVMPPRAGPEKPAASLIHPPAADPSVKVAMEPVPVPAPAPAAPAPSKAETVEPTSAVPAKPSEAPPPAASPSATTAAEHGGGPPTVALPTVPAAEAAKEAAPAANAEPTPAEPTIPPVGDVVPPPSFAQLPARDDLKPLPPAPLPELLRNNANGMLPISAGGKEARTVYARPFANEKKLPQIAIVVTGLGLSKDATEAAISKLPPEVSLSFSPYSGNLDNWIKRARNNGHEVLLDLPLESPNVQARDPGPLALTSAATPAAVVSQLEAVLGQTGGYVGVAATLRSPVVATESWTPVLLDLRHRGLLFVGDGLVGVPETDAPAAMSVTLVADETPFRVLIDARLGRLLKAAKSDGSVVTYASALPVTFERMLAWIGTFGQEGVVLAPVSAVVRTPK